MGKTCEYCGNEFWPKTIRGRFCSTECCNYAYYDNKQAERAALLAVLEAGERLVKNAHSDKRGGFYVFTQRLEALEQATKEARALVGSGEEAEGQGLDRRA